MAITTLDGIIGAARQMIQLTKTASRTAVAAAWYSVFDLAGNPGAGTLAGSSTAAGVVPTDATAGCPTINAFGGGATGYISGVEFGSSVACRMRISDMLFKAGAYPFNAAVTLASQPSYSSRVPGGTDYSNCEIWIEAVTVFTGNLSVAVTYTDAVNGAGRTTGTFATGLAMPVGRMFRLPLQAGDNQVSKIESVTGTIATVGTFNVLVLRPLWTGRVRIINDGDTHSFEKTTMETLYADSALVLQVAPDSTATGIPEIEMTVVNG